MLSRDPLSQLFCVVFHAFIFEYCCEANYFSPPLGKFVKGKCVKLGTRVLAEHLALMGMVSSLVLHGHPWREKSYNLLETAFNLSK